MPIPQLAATHQQMKAAKAFCQLNVKTAATAAK